MMYVGETFRNNSFNFVTIRYSKRKSSFLKSQKPHDVQSFDISSALKKAEWRQTLEEVLLAACAQACCHTFFQTFLFWVSMWAIVIVNWRVQRDIWQSLTKKLKESKKFRCSRLLLQHPFVLTGWIFNENSFYKTFKSV